MNECIDDRTPRLNIELPVQSNSLKDDNYRLRSALATLDQVVATIDEDGTIPDDQLAGNVVRTGETGTIPPSVLPSIAIPNSFKCNDVWQMMALDAGIGDICIRKDTDQVFIRISDPVAGQPPDELNWKEILPNLPPVDVQVFQARLASTEQASTKNTTDITGLKATVEQNDQNTNTQIGNLAASVHTAAQADGRFAFKADSYTKEASDARYYTMGTSDARYQYKGDGAVSGLQVSGSWAVVNGKHVVRTVNGVGADGNGACSISTYTAPVTAHNVIGSWVIGRPRAQHALGSTITSNQMSVIATGISGTWRSTSMMNSSEYMPEIWLFVKVA